VFNIGMMELLLILLVAFVIVGPKDLPKVARWIARSIKKLRKLYQDVKKDLGLDELLSDVEETKKDLESTFREADVSADLKQAAEELRSSVEDVQQTVQRTAKDIEEEVNS